MTFSHILDQIEMFYFTILSESVTNTSIYSNEKFLIFSMQDCFNCKKLSINVMMFAINSRLTRSNEFSQYRTETKKFHVLHNSQKF